MKTFKQFIEQKNDVPSVVKSLQGIAQDASKNIDPKDLKNKVVGTVIDKLTGGAEGRQKGVEAIQGKLNTMSTDLPKNKLYFGLLNFCPNVLIKEIRPKFSWILKFIYVKWFREDNMSLFCYKTQIKKRFT